jgi:hypothetical protein
MARYHRKSPPKQGHPEFAALRPRDRHVVSACAGILRIAIGLDRTHAGLVSHLHAHLAADGGTTPRRLAGDTNGTGETGESGDPGDAGDVGADPGAGERLVIDVTGRADSDLSLEQYTATERRDLLEAVLGLPIVVQIAAPAEPVPA